MKDELTEHNIRLLDEQLRKGEFPNELLPAMREKIREGKEAEFYLPFVANVAGDRVNGSLYFERLPDHKTYELPYFNLDMGERSKTVWRENIFMMSPSYEVTLREANNLMQGRSIYREPIFDPAREGYWVSLDRKDQWMGHARLEYERSGFRAEEGIASSRLASHLKPEERAMLAEALKQGDRKELTIEVMGATRKIWAEAAPGFGIIHLSDARGKAVMLQDLFLSQKPVGVSVGHERGRSR